MAMKGYSFVELMVVFVILVILVLAAIETYVFIKEKSYTVSEKATIAALQTAIKAYYARNLVWFQGATLDPFSLMQYPPLRNCCSSTAGVLPETWGVKYNAGGWYDIACPHANIDAYTQGLHWDYFFSGTNAGKVIIQGTIGHAL
jgi:type II secretory pathway pseudopilin PulG